MSTVLQHIVNIIYTFCALCQAQKSCDFSPLQTVNEYHTFSSITKLPYGNDPPDPVSDYMGFKGQIGGVNDNGTIYLVGGGYAHIANNMYGPVQWWNSINVYDSFISYDATVDIQKDLSTIQSPWKTSPYYALPDITTPDGYVPIYNAPNNGGFLCDVAQCSTYIDNKIYIINPTITSQQMATWINWPVMIIFDMNDTNPHFLSESEFISVPPNNYWHAGLNGTASFDRLKFSGDGCTTNNNTHIFHFNWAVRDVRYYHYPTTYSYHPPTNQWSLLSGNPSAKFKFTCSGDVSGRYMYLLAGTTTDADLRSLASDPSYATDKYDTWTDTWIRLPSTADYPETYGRQDALAVLDKTRKSILVTSGRIQIELCEERCDVSVNKVEIFRLDTEDWFVPLDPKDEVFLDTHAFQAAVVKVDDFRPQGQVSNASADVIFMLGGGVDLTVFKNDIVFMSILTEKEYYPDNIVRIEGVHPDDEEIQFTAFDPWQRFELSFRIVITDGIEYEIDDSWNISFTIDGKSIRDLNEEYDTQILTRPACQCWDKTCENLPVNVKQVTIVELMIPSHRALSNGYCVDRDVPWIFSHEKNSTITVTATDGDYNHTREFEFEFMKIRQITAKQSNESGVIRGCQVTNESSGALTHFAIRCDGYTCDKCPIFSGIGRDSKKGRQKQYLRNEIEYNILMNDVLLAPDAYVRQDFEENRVIGTESLDSDSLIALVRARTAVGTWYQECFYNFSYEWTKDWQSLASILNENTNTDLWNDVIDKLNSDRNEDIIAAYSILQEMVIEDEVPDGEDPIAEISDALQNIIERMDDTDANITMDDITSDLALVDLLTSDSNLVEPDIVFNISSEFIPKALAKAVLILNDEEAEYEPGVLADTVQNVGQIANKAATNLLNVSNLTETIRQNLVDDVQQIMSKGLTGSWQSEVLLLVGAESKTKGYTLNKEEACELDDVLVRIPPDNAATDSDTVQCVLTTTNEDEVAVDVFDASGVRVFRTNDSCLPYFISMPLPDDGAFERASSLRFPQCTFWNKSDEEWSGKGCFVYEMDNDSITCACSHLTTFKIRSEHFDPKAELLSGEDMRRFTATNIEQHPTTLVTMVMLVLVLCLVCVCVPNNNADRPLIAFEDIIYKEFRDKYLHKHQQWYELQQINRWYGKVAQHKRASVPPDSPRSPSSSVSSTNIPEPSVSTRSTYYCLLSAHLFVTYLKNDHTILSVFDRTDGTNLSTKQRIGLSLLYLYLIMMSNAIFYGRQYDRHPMGDLTASALISLFATFPVYLIRKLFQWSKPIEVKSVISWPLSEPDTQQTRRIAMDMKEIRKRMHPDQVNEKEKPMVAQQIRSVLFDYNYPFPNVYKKVAWAVLMMTAVVCIIISVTYGIGFDIRADQMAVQIENHKHLLSKMTNITNDSESNGCWNMSLKLVAQSEVFEDQIAQIEEEEARIEALDEGYADDFEALFGDAEVANYDATKWLLNVLISFLTSVFIWQPASIYFVTWLKIWAFHNGFVMEFSYSNLAMFLANYLCCYCVCGGFNRRKKKKGPATATAMAIGSVSSTSMAINPSASLPTITATHEESKTDLPSVSDAPGLCGGLSLDMLLDDESSFQVLSLLCDENFAFEMPEDAPAKLAQLFVDD
eukprot:566591_1